MKGIQLENRDFLVDVVRRDGLIVGGMVVDDILQQNQAIILDAHAGEIKSSPTLGVGVSDILLDHDPTAWKRRIREQLELDGQRVDALRVGTNKIEISAKYKV